MVKKGIKHIVVAIPGSLEEAADFVGRIGKGRRTKVLDSSRQQSGGNTGGENKDR